jgi:hypothetical protein
MPITIEHESGNAFRVRATGILRKSELQGVQSVAAREIQARGKVRLLFILEEFKGWERGADWGDVSFYATHGRNVERIAIVGEEEWRDEALMFAGAGLRKGEVGYFVPAERQQAIAWLSQ